jgi:hypothetical protein
VAGECGGEGIVNQGMTLIRANYLQSGLGKELAYVSI